MKKYRPDHLVSLSPGHRVRARRGTIIVLVVAVLGLLAVIGTAYILAARTDKANSSSSNATYNLDLARYSIMNQVNQILGNAVVGGDGIVGSYAVAGGYGTQPARLYDYPDANLEPWLVTHLHVQGGDPGTPGINAYSTLTTNAFSPLTGTYSIGLQKFPYNVPPYIGALSNVVGDQTLVDTTTDDPPTGGASDSYMYLLPFSDASGIRYRYGLRILDTSRMANLNVGATDDPTATGDTAGSWLDAMRLAPASGTLQSPNAYFNTFDAPANLHASPAPSGLGRSNAGSTLGNASFSLANWMQQVLRLERPTDYVITPFDLADELELRSYGEFGTSYHIRAATGNGGTYVMWPNTLSADNNKGSPSSIVIGNPSRRSYSFYSWSRDLRPYPDPSSKYTLTPTDSFGIPQGYVAANMFPTRPARVSANPQTSTSITSPSDMMFYAAMAASNIATLMEFSCGSPNSNGSANATFPGGPVAYTHEEACAFAANYCAAKWNGFTADPAFPTVQAYFLPAGPSFVDDKGICIRSATSATTPVHREFGSAGTDLHAETAGKVYLGYSAQPCISEVAVNELYNNDGDNATPAQPDFTQVNYTAVELYNPYGVILSLSGYHLKSGDGTLDVDLSDQFIPANGYLVITSDGQFDGNGDKGNPIPGLPRTRKAVKSTLKANGSGDTQFILYRTYYNRSFTQAYAPVDQINYSALVDNNAPAPAPALPSKKDGEQAKDFSISRPGGPTTGPWSPTINPGAYVRATGPNAPTLGDDNGAAGTGFPLPDRYAYPTAGRQGDPFGMGEFARIMHIANEFDGSNTNGTILPTGGPNNGGLLPDHLAQLKTTTAPYNTMDTAAIATLPLEAQILFDFYAAPVIYPVGGGAPVDAAGKHDIRAVRLLEQVSMIDRVSEFDIDVGGGGVDINKIRIPGQINVNTASGDVLRAIVNASTPAVADQMVANILGYRKRAAANDPTCTYNGKMTPDFTAGTHPGAGIRSLAELLVPLQASNTTGLSASAPTSIDQRDMLWGSMANYCTVRSDTFVVYGYLEALKVNPKYTGAHDNGQSWYGAVVDDLNAANVANIPNLRVARRRWVAIVDRSFCNYPKTDQQHFTLPRVVAIKDLPQ